MQPGTRVGRYELKGLLGEGGMGSVYRAVLHGPAGFRKPVALKILKPGAEGLEREARLGGLLQHPNLVEVYALEQVDGRWVCAMELVEGGSLEDRIPLSPGALIDLSLQVARGMTHAHDRIGLVHLDLKPANLLLDGTTVKIADLGIARARGFATERKIRGTPAYMAPEHWAGWPVDRRADIWSMGVVLRELASGSRSGPCPDWLEPVVDRCLRQDPNERFASMKELAAALRGLASFEPGTPPVPVPVPSGAPSTAPSDGLTFVLGTAGPDSAATNLGEEVDAFVGRADELARLDRLLGAPGLVTIKGTGGLGKTRLARQLARSWHRSRGEQAWFVDLDHCRDAIAVTEAVAATLELRLLTSALDERADRIGWALAGRGDAVLVLDNFEQVLEAAPLVARWRSTAPELRIVVTTRERLRLDGEQVFELDSLPEEDAVALLVERAGAAGRDISGDPVLPELVRRLDGLPLALELAAGRLGMMSPSAVLERLDQRFKLLASRSRTRDPRQATLQGALDWSWELLAEPERQALAQCSAFVGSWTVEAAEAVVAVDGAWALDLVESLVERSLLVARADGRLALLASTRDYAAARLQEAGVHLRHARWYGQFGGSNRSGEAELRRALEPDLENAVAACRRALDVGEHGLALDNLETAWAVLRYTGPVRRGTELAAELVDRADLGPIDRARALVIWAEGRWMDGDPEARGALEQAAALADPEVVPGLRGRLARTLGNLYRDAGEVDAARTEYELAVALSERASDPWAEVFALATLGGLERDFGQTETSERHLSRGLEIARRIGDRAGSAHLLVHIGLLHRDRGELDAAREQLTEALKLHREVRDRSGEAIALGNLGVIASDQGDLPESKRLMLESLRVSRELGNRRRVVMDIGNLGLVMYELGDLEAARAHLEEALALGRVLGSRFDEAVQSGGLAVVARARGDREEARRLATHAEAEAEAIELAELGAAFAAIRGRADFDAGELQRAAQTLERAGTAMRDRFDNEACLALARAARAWAAAGEGERARDLARTAEQIARTQGPLVRAEVLMQLGAAWAALGEPDRRITHLDEALALLHKVDLPPGARLWQELRELDPRP